MSEMKLKEITWQERRWSDVALIDGTEVATLSYSTARNDPLPYHVHFSVLGRSWTVKFKTRDIAMRCTQGAIQKVLLRYFTTSTL